MNTHEEPPRSRNAIISPQAIVGLGVTIAWLGLLCVMLGWAEALRHVPSVARIWLPLGAVLMIGGGIGAFVGHTRKGR